MVKVTSLIAALTALTACGPDESISGFVDPETEFTLREIDGRSTDIRATIQFPETGSIVGQAPCNRYFATQTKPYPWFGVEAIGATRMACAALEEEGAYFDALSAMTLAEVAGNTLILTNETGREMVFRAP